MQTFSDQVKMLYREYAVASNAWKTEKHLLEKKVRCECLTMSRVVPGAYL